MPSDPPEVCSSSESMTSISSFRSLAAARGSECNIRVVCRFRPLNESEIQTGSSCVVKFPTNAKDTVVVSGKAFVYDRVFAPETDQHQVYLDVAQQIVDDVLNGYNGTIFAYGQTSSGKTHTMEGSLGDELNQGIVPRIINDIFNHIYSMDSNLQFHIKISYFEIYMDKIRDLLDPAKVNLAVHEDKNRVPYVKGCTERFVSCPDEVLIAMEEGKANRHIAVTNMNEHSSRSHCVFLIDVKQENMETNKKLTGKLYLVDLAGSEKVSKTGAEGTVLDEARNINRSLSALGNVIAALAEGTKSHVPYRDSKLTRILQESLGGNARTTIIICCSPSSYNECETKSTLYFGQRAKTIKNTVAINEELTADEWKLRFDKEHQKVLKLRNMFALADTELQKWRSGASMSEDSLKQFFQRSLIESNVLYDENDEDCRSGRFNNHGITDDERLQMERERSALCQRLDEKDDEIAGLEAKNAGLLNDLSEKDEELHRIENQLNELQVERTFYMQRYEKTKDEVQMALKTLEDLSMKYEARIVDLSKRLEERRQVVDQYEQRIKKLTEVEREFEVLKRKFEDLTNLSDEQHSRIQLLERTRTELESLKIGLETRNDSLANEVAELKKDSPGQCDGPSEDHLEKLKRDLADRTKTLELTRQQLCEARHFQETLGAELDQSRKACEQKSSQLDEYIKQHESQQQAKEGLRALEQTIRTELRNLHVLRQRFVEDLQSRLRTRNLADSMSSSSLFCDGSAAETASDEAKGQSSIVQRQKIEYLENNLEMLTGLHKQLVKENADLLEEVPKLETKFRETWNRLKGLEAALKEAKETAMRDRKRYQYEVNRIKEAVRMRTMTRRPNAAQIVIPVQAGRPPCPSFGGPSVQ